MLSLDYIGCHYKESPTFLIDRPSGCSNYLFLLFLSDIYIVVDSEKKHFESGTAILYTPAHPQYYHQPISGFDNDWFHFSGLELESFLSELQFSVNTPFKVKDINDIHKRIQIIEREYLMKDINYEWMVDNRIKELIIHLSRNNAFRVDNTQNSSDMESRFRQARSIILSQLEKPWTIHDMAKLLDLSQSRFSHIYSSIFNTSPKNDLMTERMNMAKFLLQSQSYTISEVASKVGYDNIYHFSKQFKKQTGYSPSSYR
ncbi:MAG TPA: AraC family transcriptional regulator [Lachnospiraceae bacterium]|nr:AraC family transcriptional regulator [Lachnospiraceae bacterium]